MGGKFLGVWSVLITWGVIVVLQSWCVVKIMV